MEEKMYARSDMENFAIFAFRNFAGSNVIKAFEKWVDENYPIDDNTHSIPSQEGNNIEEWEEIQHERSK